MAIMNVARTDHVMPPLFTFWKIINTNVFFRKVIKIHVDSKDGNVWNTQISHPEADRPRTLLHSETDRSTRGRYWWEYHDALFTTFSFASLVPKTLPDEWTFQATCSLRQRSPPSPHTLHFLCLAHPLPAAHTLMAFSKTAPFIHPDLTAYSRRQGPRPKPPKSQPPIAKMSKKLPSQKKSMR